MKNYSSTFVMLHEKKILIDNEIEINVNKEKR